jgi:hypothetical protein
VAELVASRLLNRDVAAQPFVKPRDFRLRRIFAKIGVTSRTELARGSLSDDQGQEPGHFTGATPASFSVASSP